MIHLDNLAQFSDGIEVWISECEDLAEDALRALAMGAFEFVLQGTPQWSGELVSAWTITLGAPASGSSPGIFKGSLSPSPIPEPYSKQTPNEAAMQYARSIAMHALPQARLGGDIFISNTSDYASMVQENRDESGKMFIRQVNMPIEMVEAAVRKFGGPA